MTVHVVSHSSNSRSFFSLKAMVRVTWSENPSFQKLDHWFKQWYSWGFVALSRCKPLCHPYLWHGNQSNVALTATKLYCQMPVNWGGKPNLWLQSDILNPPLRAFPTIISQGIYLIGSILLKSRKTRKRVYPIRS